MREKIAAAGRKGNYSRRIPEGYAGTLRKLHNLKLGKGEARRLLSEIIAADARRMVADNLQAMKCKAKREKAQAY